MSVGPLSQDAGYSPELSAELTLHGERFAVAALGPDAIVIRSPRAVAPGVGTVRMMIDGQATVYHVDLCLGIDPDRREQAFRPVEVAAAV